MPQSRKTQVNLIDTPYYHCVSRCVRRSFLCGKISLEETVMIYRQRLYDISWLMRNLNEHIARVANKEDGCTGRFYSLPSLAITLRAS
ncbi:MAG: hypothetical protein ACJAV1_000239 [Paraglaciecola sp.]|jgi:hypothetical protein